MTLPLRPPAHENKHVTGQPATEYISEETPMSAYANLHIALEQMRVRALAALHGSPISDHGGAPASTSDPPRVLVLGPENSGKTTICKILTNYAVSANQSWAPVLANVDPGSVGLCLYPYSARTEIFPGCVDHTRYGVRYLRRISYRHIFAGGTTWHLCHIATDASSLKRVAAARLLVWAYQRSKESSLARSLDPQLGGKHYR
jgi:hypothetical protein